MENYVLKNNLLAISKYSPKLAEKIKNITKLNSQIELLQNENGLYNLSYNGFFIHDNQNPENEAKNILDSIKKNDLNSINIIFGLGLGYVFTEFGENAKGKIIVFEPSLEILRSTLELVDLTQYLNKPEVYIVNDLDDFQNFFKLHFTFNMHTQFVFLNFYKAVFVEEFNKILYETKSMQRICEAHVSVQRKYGTEFYYSAIEGLSKKINIPPLGMLSNIFKDKPALVVSAGPSLHKNIEFIKKYRNKFVLFAVGTAYKALKRNGIEPDFLNIIERKDNSSQLLDTDTSNLNFISETYTNTAFYKKDYKRKFLTFSQENPVNTWVADLLGINYFDYETKGTVSYSAMYSAKTMGCNPIILIGQDLAYVDNRCYSKDSIYGDVYCKLDELTNKYVLDVPNLEDFASRYVSNYETIDKTLALEIAKGCLQQLQQRIVTVGGLNGELLPTSSDYMLFISYFRDFALRYNKEINLINASDGGAFIEGFEFQKLENILSSLSEDIDVEAILSKINLDYNPDLKRVTEKISSDIEVLKKALDIFEDGKKSIKNYKTELNRYKKLTIEVHKYLKKCLDYFVTLNNVHQQKSKIFEMSVYNEKMTLSWLLKEKDNQYDYETQKQIGEAFEAYYNNGCEKIKKVITLLINAYEGIKANESSNSESQKNLCLNK